MSRWTHDHIPDQSGRVAIVTGAALLFVFLLGWMFSRFQKKSRALPVEVPLPSHVRALRELERLRQSPRATEAEVEAFYVAVSAILRRASSPAL